MAIPTPVNGQITDALNAVHDDGGMDAVTPIVDLVEAIGHRPWAERRGVIGSLQEG